MYWETDNEGNKIVCAVFKDGHIEKRKLVEPESFTFNIKDK